MNEPSHTLTDPAPSRVWRWALPLALAALLLSPLLDGWGYHSLHLMDSKGVRGLGWRLAKLIGIDPPLGDGFRLYRVAGYFPTWLLIAAVIWRLDLRPARRTTRGVAAAAALLTTLLAAGLVAAVVKSLVRRLRPDPQAFDAFAFRPWGERGFDGGGLSFPSEHAAIALTGALMLCRLYPRGWFVYLLWAGSCSAGRVMMQDHFISDIAGSLLLAVLMQAAAWRIWRARLMPQGSDQLPITPA